MTKCRNSVEGIVICLGLGDRSSPATLNPCLRSTFIRWKSSRIFSKSSNQKRRNKTMTRAQSTRVSEMGTLGCYEAHLNMDGKHAFQKLFILLTGMQRILQGPTSINRPPKVRHAWFVMDKIYPRLLVRFQHSTHHIRWTVYPGSSEIPKSSWYRICGSQDTLLGTGSKYCDIYHQSWKQDSQQKQGFF